MIEDNIFIGDFSSFKNINIHIECVDESPIFVDDTPADIFFDFDKNSVAAGYVSQFHVGIHQSGGCIIFPMEINVVDDQIHLVYNIGNQIKRIQSWTVDIGYVGDHKKPLDSTVLNGFMVVDDFKWNG